jgi:branched-chain amino acid aminotransferase
MPDPNQGVWWNGTSFSGESSATSRAEAYGDGLFESIRVQAGSFPLLAHHLVRLEAGLAAIRLDWPIGLSSATLRDAIAFMWKELGAPSAAIFRLQISRAGPANGYRPKGNASVAKLSVRQLPATAPQAQKLAVWTDMRRVETSISAFKTMSALPYVLAAEAASALGVDDVLLLTPNEEVSECSRANLFVSKGGRLYTPSLSAGCVAGVMRAAILDAARIIDMPISCAAPIPLEWLLEADEIFLTNATQGIIPVSNLRFPFYECVFEPSPGSFANRLCEFFASHFS